MKKLTVICIALLLAAAGCKKDNSAAELEKEFRGIPSEIRTAAYWYWISDHISKEGVINDLKSMKEAGIERLFIGNIDQGPQDTGRGKVELGTDEWWDIIHTALKTATELDIEIGIFNSPGWSQSGGPWVKSQHAMRYLASTSTLVEGGKKVEITLPRPEKRFKEDFQDVKVLAYPAIRSVSHKFDGKLQSPSENELVKVIKVNGPFTLRGIKIQPTTRPINSPAHIEVKTADGYKTIANFTISRYFAAENVGFDPYCPVTVTVPATTANEFRLVINGSGTENVFSEIELSSVPFVESYAEKTFAKMFQEPLPLWDQYMWRDQPVLDDPSLAVDPSKVIDISQYLKGEVLSWDAPAGNWVVMRTGMLPTGTFNAPAGPHATGLEIDKMSRELAEYHFESYMAEFIRRIPEADRKSWKVVVQDSYETGGQNFTDTFLADFENRYGYSAVPYLPVYQGVVVGSEDLSDRFLWDMRRLVADKVAYDYVGGLRDISHKYGLTTWLENYGHWGYPGEFLMYGGQSDEIGGEFWNEGTLGDIENRAASSCGHIYNKNRIWAESFTAGGPGYHRGPAQMKQRGDRFFTEGINATLLHLVIHQPYEDREPGVNAGFGNEFNRKNTWFPHMHLFTEYLKRVNYMLQQGMNIADAAYFIGEDAPKMTGVTDPVIPKGYQFDYINAEVLIRDAFVKDGLLTLPHGTQYRILVLPKQETMRPEMMAKLEQLINDGAVVLGPPPTRSPSLENYPRADAAIAEASKRLWSQIDPVTKYAKIGNGTLIDGMDMTQAFALIGCAPDMSIKEDEPLLYGHRNMGKTEIYFVSNQSDKGITASPVFRVKGMQPELWNAMTGDVRTLPSYSETADGTMVPLRLDGFESAFIVFRKKGKPQASADVNLNFPVPAKIAEPAGAWTVSFDTARRGPAQPVTMDRLYDITQSEDFDIKHYSGMLEYENTFDLADVPKGRVYVDLGKVTSMAKVWVNGEYAGGVWTPPYRVDITDFVKKGANDLLVEVTTTWMNRLIGDQKLPESERRTWVTHQPWGPDSGLQPSGLMGPVTIEQTIH